MASLTERMAEQRKLRLAQEAADKKAEEALADDFREATTEEATRAFFDRVDTSGGKDACHPWTGALNKTWTHYPLGKFKHPSCNSSIAQRVLCCIVMDYEPPPCHDTHPICNNHLCMNPDHWAIWLDKQHSKMLTLDEYKKGLAEYCPEAA